MLRTNRTSSSVSDSERSRSSRALRFHSGTGPSVPELRSSSLVSVIPNPPIRSSAALRGVRPIRAPLSRYLHGNLETADRETMGESIRRRLTAKLVVAVGKHDDLTGTGRRLPLLEHVGIDRRPS